MSALPKTNYLSIQEAANYLGVSSKTLRRWEQAGKLIPERTEGGHRRYVRKNLIEFKQHKKKKVITTYPTAPSRKPFSSNMSLHAQPVIYKPFNPYAETVQTDTNNEVATTEHIGFPVAENQAELFTPLHINQAQVLKKAGLGLIALTVFVLLANTVNASFIRNFLDSNPERVAENNRSSNVLATRDSLLSTEFNVAVESNFSDDVAIDGTLNLNGNTLVSAQDLQINPLGGAVNIGGATATNVDEEGGDLLISGDFETNGDIFAVNSSLSGNLTVALNADINGDASVGSLTINAETFTDLTGTGLQFNAGTLETTLGTSISSAEIEDDSILEVDLNISNTGNDGQVLTYNSSTGGFEWADDQAGDESPWTDGGSIVYLTDTTQDLALGGTDSSSPFYFDVSEGDFTATGSLSATTDETINGIDINAGAVSDVVNLTINSGGDLTIGSIGLSDVGVSNVTSGASLIGVFDEFTNSSATNLQDILDDFDAAIGGGASKWTQDTGFVYLTNGTDSVTIGGTTELGKLAVDGDADEVQLLIQGNATQTSPLAVFENSTGTDLLTLDNSGNLTLAGSVNVNGDTISDFTGNGLTLSAGSLTINLPSPANALSSTTSSGSGLEILAQGLTLIQGCSDGEVLKWNESNDSWECSTDSGAAFAVVNIENNDVAVGSDVDTIDFSTDFSVTASPSNEANVSIADDVINFTEISDSLTLDAATDIALGALTLSTSGTGALDFNSTGQVSFAGNVNAENGLDVTGAALTVGGNATLSTAGALTIASTITAISNETINGIDINSGTVSDVVNLTINSGGDLTIGSIGLNDTGSDNVTSGASLVGAFDEFDNSASATVQDVLDDLDLAIGDRTYTEDNFVTDGESLAASIDALDIALANVSGSAFTGFSVDGDSGDAEDIDSGDTLLIVGGTNGIDTTVSATDTITINLDTTEIGSTTFGSGSGFTWTFDAGATDPTIAFASDAITIGGAATLNYGGTIDLGTNTIADTDLTGDWDFNSGTLTGITALTATTGNLTTLDLGTNTLTDGNFNGNWSFNSGNLSSIGTISASGAITAATNETINGIDINAGTVSDVVNLTINSGGDLTIGSIGLNDTGSSNTDSGASLVGIFDEFDNSASSTVQDVIDDIDAAIGNRTYTEDNFVTDGQSLAASIDALDIALDNVSGSAFTGFSIDGDTGTAEDIDSGDTLLVLGGTNGIDTVVSATDTITINLDTTEIGSTTFGSGSGFTWTFDAGATDPTLVFASNSVTANVNWNLDGGFDVDDAFVVANGGVLTTSQTANFDGSVDVDGAADFSGGLTNSAGELLVSGGNLQLNDSINLTIGTGDDLTLVHNGTNTVITSATGDLIIDNTLATGSTIFDLGTDTSATDLLVRNNSGTQLFSINGAGAVQIGSNGQDGSLTLYNELGATDRSVTFNVSASQTQDTTYTLPPDDGDSNYVLTTDGSGVLTWQSTGGIGAGGDITAVIAGNGLTDGGTTGDVTLNVGAGNGISVAADAVAIALLSSGDGSGSSSSNSGLEFAGGSSNQLALLQGCQDDEVLAWNDSGNVWECASVTGIGGAGDITAVGDVTSGAAFTNGGSGNSLYFNNNSESGQLTADTLSGSQTWTLPDATGTFALLENAQTFSALQTFSSGISSTLVNSAGGSATSTTLSGTLGAFDGSDTFRGLFIDYANADHTGSSNNFFAIDIDAITGDAQANEYALNIGSGWDSVLRVNGTEVINGSGQLVAGQITGTLFNSDSDDASANAIAQGDTLTIAGSSDGIDTSHSGDTITINLDTAEIGTTTFGSGSGFTWTFDAGATDPTIAFASDAITIGGAGTINFGGTIDLGTNTIADGDFTGDWDFNSGDLLGIVDLTASGTITLSGLSDGYVTATSGVLGSTATIPTTDLSGTLFSTAGDSGSSTVEQGDTVAINGGTNGIDTSLSGDTWTLDFDSTEVGTTTWGSGSGITWTFNAGATDPAFAFASDQITATAASTIFSGDITVQGGTVNGATGESIDLGVAASDTLTFTTGGATELLLTGTNLTPGAAEGNSLGSSSAEWEQLFLGDNNGISFGLDQDWSFGYDEATDDRLELTTSANSGFLVTTSSTTTDAFGVVANSLTSGSALDISSTSTSTTAITDARLGYFNWAPGSTTTVAGDLVRINIGTNGNVTNLFNVTDNGSSLFRVSEAQIESAVPHAFTSPGDVSFSFDAIFTNQTASQIESYGPLSIIAGESFESNDLTLQTYNSGDVILTNGTLGTIATFAGSTGDLTLTGDATISGGALTLGQDGQDGSLTIYNELGGTDYSVVFQPSGSQTQDTTYTLPPDDGDDNYVLTTNGSGVLAWESVNGISGISGTGADGQITYFTGTGTVASDANFLWDDAGQAFSVNGTSEFGDGGSTNYAAFNTTGDLTFNGTADSIVGPATFNLLNSGSTTINFGSAATTLNIADAAITGTIDIGGVTSDGASTVNIATNSTTADAITIGNNNSSTTVAITGGDDWSITAAGLATFASNVNANGGLDVDDAFVVADGGVLTTSQTANFDGSLDVDGAADFSAGLTNSAGELLVSGGNLQLNDSINLTLGTGDDLTLVHNGTNTVITSATGDLIIDNTLATGSTIFDLGTDTSATDVLIRNNSGSTLFSVNGAGAASFTGNVTLGDANTDTLTINAGSSGTGISFGDSSFANCSALETVSGVLTCGTDSGATPPDFDEVYAQSILNTNLTMEIDDTGGLTYNMTTTGDFVIQDGGNNLATFGDDSVISFTPSNGTTSGGRFLLNGNSTAATTTAGLLDIDITTITDSFEGINMDLNISDDAGVDTIRAAYFNIDNDATTADDSVQGVYINMEDNGTDDQDQTLDVGLYINNADSNDEITDGIRLDGRFIDGLQIGDSTDVITTAINIGSTGVTTDISLQNSETISNDTDGTIAFGATTLSGVGTTAIVSDQTTVALLNTNTTTINAFGAATTLNLADAAITGTIDIGGVTSDGASTINIATNATTADALTFGNNNASTTFALTGGDDWSINAAGDAVFEDVTLTSLTDGTASLTGGTLDLGTNTILDGNFNGNWAFNSGALSGISTIAASSGASTSLSLTRSSAGQWISFNDGTDSWGLYNSAGSPEGALTANTGALSMDTTNGTLYVKTDDGDNTGWVNLATGGSTEWTLSGTTVHPNSATTDMAVGVASDTLVAPFSVDESENTVRIGEGANSNATLNMYASDNDTGSITYTTDDEWNFTGGGINLDSYLDLDSTSATAFTLGDGSNTYVTFDGSTDAGDTLFGITGASSGITSGTILGVTADTITTGIGLDLSVDGLTSGNGLNLASTSTVFTSGNIGYVEWAPGSTTNASGDVFQINIGANGTTTGYILNITDSGSTVFGVSETKITSALPHEFTAAGDVSVAYDLAFTNQTSSLITSNASLTIEAGEPAESNILTLKTYNSGYVQLDGGDLVVGTASGPTNIGGNGILAYGAICADDTLDTADDCIDSARAAGSVQGISSSFAIDDIAENFPTLDESTEPADIVALDYQAIPDGADETVYETEFVKRATTADANNLLGVISEKPGVLLGGWKQDLDPRSVKEVAVALSGRVPVKVTSANGTIEPGDYITAGSIAGVGVKSTNPSDSIIGKALDRYENADTKAIGSVLIFVNTQWNREFASIEAPDINEDLQAQVTDLQNRVAILEAQLDSGEEGAETESFTDLTVTNLSVLGDAVLGDTVINGKLNVGTIQIDNAENSINAIGTLKIQDLALGNIEFLGGLITFDTEGNIVAKEVTAEKFNVAGASAGIGTLPSGGKEIFIETSLVTENSLIFVTPKRALAFPLAVTEKVEGEGFWVEIPATQSQATEFDWFIVDHTAGQ